LPKHNYSISDKETDGLIGILGYFDIDQLNQTAEVGITIGNKNYWNKDCGTEALYRNLENMILYIWIYCQRNFMKDTNNKNIRKIMENSIKYYGK
jgi:hypothetical protein